MSYHRSAHDVAGSFDRGMQGLAMGLGATLIQDRAIRQADRAEAAHLRGIAGAVRQARAQDAATIDVLAGEVARLQRELAAANARAIRAEALLRRL